MTIQAVFPEDFYSMRNGKRPSKMLNRRSEVRVKLSGTFESEGGPSGPMWLSSASLSVKCLQSKKTSDHRSGHRSRLGLGRLAGGL